MKPNRLSNILISLGSIAILVSSSIAIENITIENRAEKQSNWVVSKIEEIIDEEDAYKEISGSDKENEESINDDQVNGEGSEEHQTISSYELDEVMVIDGHRYIGEIKIAKADLILPIYADFSYDSLAYSPCRFSGSTISNNLIIAGHNYTRHFGRLDWLSSGDNITLIIADGTNISYNVKCIETIHEGDLEKLISKDEVDWDLTLFTCTLDGSNRIVVRCKRD